MPRRLWLSLCLTALSLAACGGAKKPTEAEIARYLAQATPSYFTVGAVTAQYELVTDADGTKLPAGSWKIMVQMSATATQDLFTAAAGAQTRRMNFDRIVSGAEGYRVARIQAVNSYATKLGLLKPGAATPGPAFPVVPAIRKGQTATEPAALLAEPAGDGWHFSAWPGTSPPALPEPWAKLQAEMPEVTLVQADSPEDREALIREKAFLGSLIEWTKH